jgi:hypothetical protein
MLARLTFTVVLISTSVFTLSFSQEAGDAAQGTLPYDRFEMYDACASCHVDIARQYEQTLMFESFTHHWDEIEYFELALPHSEKVAKVAGVKAGCNGCHAPLAFLAGDIPPQRPSANSRANEGVSCDLCHSITGFEGDVPFNFNFIASPGETKQGIREDGESPVHKINVNPFMMSAELCGTCHNEKDPWGVWVKSTHLEWKEGPYSKAGIVCQDCHMPPGAGNSSPGIGKDRSDIRQHLFHGAHDDGKIAGSAEIRIHPESRLVDRGSTILLSAVIVNSKAGHMLPSGSAEERVVWLHVEAVDARGCTYHLPVDPKGFEGEEFTLASAESLAYQDIGEIQNISGFPGLKRDGEVPEGDRIFRLPYLDSQGRMTVAQWNTASLGPDYRLAPLEAITETFTWELPHDIPAGPVQVTATLWYSKLVSSVAEFLGVPAEEARPVRINTHSTSFEVR